MDMQPSFGSLDQRKSDIPFKAYWDAFIWLVGLLSAIPEPFTRKEAGIRYYTGIRVFMALGIFGGYLAFGAFVQRDLRTAILYALTFLLAAGMAATQLIKNWWRVNIERRPGLTHYIGTSRFQGMIEWFNNALTEEIAYWSERAPKAVKFAHVFYLRTWFVFRVEPLLVAVVALFLAFVDLPLGGFIFYTALALAVKNQMVHAQEREAALNRADARLLADYDRHLMETHIDPRILRKQLGLNEEVVIAPSLQQIGRRQSPPNYPQTAQSYGDDK